jgi:hypothetical protein
MHTGQDRRIHTGLAFTLAKNATKLNPFEIISLQITRKDNICKTEETLARAVVNSGDETDQRIQSLMFMMMTMIVDMMMSRVYCDIRFRLILVWFGLFVHPFCHICKIGHVDYRLQFTTRYIIYRHLHDTI